MLMGSMDSPLKGMPYPWNRDTLPRPRGSLCESGAKTYPGRGGTLQGRRLNSSKTPNQTPQVPQAPSTCRSLLLLHGPCRNPHTLRNLSCVRTRLLKGCDPNPLHRKVCRTTPTPEKQHLWIARDPRGKAIQFEEKPVCVPQSQGTGNTLHVHTGGLMESAPNIIRGDLRPPHTRGQCGCLQDLERNATQIGSHDPYESLGQLVRHPDTEARSLGTSKSLSTPLLSREFSGRSKAMRAEP